MENPYNELTHRQLEDQLVENTAEWADVCSRKQELDRWGVLVQEHRGMILRAMGIGIIELNEGVN